MASLMLKSLYVEQAGRPVPVIVDCGYVREDRSRRAFEGLRAAGVSARRFSVEGFGRLLVELPIKQAADLIAAHPIVEGGGYWRTTHSWNDEPGSDLKAEGLQSPEGGDRG